MKLLPLLLTGLALSGCGSLPRDPDGTLDRVRAQHLVRVGVIADGGDPAGDGESAAFLARVAQATGARVAVRQGASEPLLLDLQAGRLDLVIGTVSPDSPWVSEVAILKPVAEPVSPQHLVVTPIARNGENKWIMLLERERDAVAGGAA
jgi:ABC-type amino acid transport substrate-binding protein